ncbi:VG15 protein [Kitasatospora purpeofusca]|uniref:VG15 protein n=1 Tax=Kitasatospora purpeofusca TaxID=67352 RepID=UPI00380B8E40
MPGSEALALARYAEVQGTSRAVLEAVQAVWRDVTPDRILSAMQAESGAAILRAVTAGQLSVAAGAEAFVASAMVAQGAAAAPLAALSPSGLVGIASDARPLTTLLYQPAITTARALALGMSPEAASIAGLNQMALMVSTQLADTARAANSVAMTAHPSVTHYVRVVRLPACARCLILAGRKYSRSKGFARHPKCDCGMEPLSPDTDRKPKDPSALVQEMTPAERKRAFGAAGADALEKGADLSKLVNARRGVETATVDGKAVKVTREGTTRRGMGELAADTTFSRSDRSRYWRADTPRLMPEQILKLAGDDRERQLELLRKHGYIK